MKKISLILWFMAAASLIVFGAIRFILGGWLNFLYIPLVIFLGSVLTVIVLNFKFYYEILSFKATRNGLNVGSTLVIAILLLFFSNFLAYRYDYSFDWTKEKVNSLSEKTLKIVNSVDKKKKFKFMIFYDSQGISEKTELISLLEKYQKVSRQISVQEVNSYQNVALSKQYLSSTDKGLVVFLETKGVEGKIKVSAPYTEGSLTSAFVKSTRREVRKIAFAEGHGEVSFGEQGSQLRGLSEQLRSLSYELSSFNMALGDQFPMDSAVVIYAGPRSEIFEAELRQIKAYLEKGGSLLLALEPQTPSAQTLADLVGVKFHKGYVVNDFVRASGRGRGGILGLLFDQKHSITKSFALKKNFIFMNEASSVMAADSSSEEYQITDLVKAAPRSVLVSDLSEKKNSDQSLYSLAVAVKKSKNKDSKEAAAVVFSDSDFMTDDFFTAGLNADMTLNAVSFLASDEDLVSISENKVSKTTLVLKSSSQRVLILVGLLIPIIFFIMGGVLWFRRKWGSQ